MIDLPAVAYALSADLLDLIVVLYVLIVVFHELTAEALAIFCFDGANVKSVNFLLASAKAVFHFAMETVSGLGKAWFSAMASWRVLILTFHSAIAAAFAGSTTAAAAAVASASASFFVASSRVHFAQQSGHRVRPTLHHWIS